MKAQYEVHLYTPTGVWLKTLTKRITRLTWSRKLGEVGRFEVTLSDRIQPVDVNLFPLNGRVLIYRKPSAKETARLEFVGFIRGWRYETDERGVTRYTFYGEDQNGLLKSRVCWPYVPYVNGFWKDWWTEYIDTLMRTMVNNNLGAGESNLAARDIMTSNTAGLTVSAEASATATSCTTAGKVTYSVAGRNLLDVCKGLSDISRSYIADGSTEAVPVYFDMVAEEPHKVTFRTRATRWGLNHRADSGNPVYIGMSMGNLRVPAWEQNRMDEVTAGLGIYFAGYPSIGWRTSDTRIGQGPLNRREACAPAGANEQYAVADKLLWEGEPQTQFSGVIQDTAGCRYGVHWGIGDELTCDFLKLQYNVMVMGVSVECQEGKEKIEPVMEVR